MFVGETGIGARRGAHLRADEAARYRSRRQYGGIDLAIVQRYINFHFSVSLDLFGSELSTNAANYFSTGLKDGSRKTIAMTITADDDDANGAEAGRQFGCRERAAGAAGIE